MTQNRGSMMLELAALKMKAHDLHLFLDTHPDDQQALDDFLALVPKIEELQAQISKQFDPISVYESAKTTPFNWITAPFPWQLQDNGAELLKGVKL